MVVAAICVAWKKEHRTAMIIPFVLSAACWIPIIGLLLFSWYPKALGMVWPFFTFGLVLWSPVVFLGGTILGVNLRKGKLAKQASTSSERNTLC